MKATMSILAAAVLIIAATTVAAASDPSTALTAEQYARAEQNLLIGLESDNQGLKESSAYMLGELKSSKAVVPLMKMLRSDDHGVRPDRGGTGALPHRRCPRSLCRETCDAV